MDQWPRPVSTSSPQRAAEAAPALSVVIPCFNEEECLRELHRRGSDACRTAQGLPLGQGGWEIVLVNDASRDGTWEIMRDLARSDPHLVCVDLARNHGHQLALTAGLHVCRGERILILDADLQDPPELLGPMLELMAETDADVVYGLRRSRAGETWFKKQSAALFYRTLRYLTEVDIPLDTGDFRLMSRRALTVFLDMPERDRFVRGMVAWIGLRQVPLPYDRQERFAGTTKYPLSKMIRLTLDAITGFSTAPLRLASHLGFLFGVASLLMLIYALTSWAAGWTVPGWTSLAVILLLVSSAQLIVLGILGEYLGRVYMQAKQRPLFVMRDILDGKSIAATNARGPGRSPATGMLDRG